MDAIPLARIHGIDDVRLDTVPFPLCGPDDLVLQIRQCGICGTDLGFLANGGLMGPGDPLAIGHEFWGVVHQAGENIDQVSVGDRIVVQPVGNDKLIGNGGPEGGFSPFLLIRDAVSNSGLLMPFPAALPDCYGALAGPRSRICLTGVHKKPISLDLVMMLAKELSVVAAMGYQQEFPEVMAMLLSDAFDPSVMVTHEFPLSEIEQAFAVARDPEKAIKILIDCQR